MLTSVAAAVATAAAVADISPGNSASSPDAASTSTLPQAMATTAHANAVAGGGLLGGIHALTGQHALPGSFELHENEATAAATAGTPLAKRNAADEASRPHFPLIGFDGKPLAKTSAALDARCQTAVLDVLRRSSGQATDRGSSGSGAASASAFSEQPPSSARAPTFYVDPLDGVHVAPLNGTHGPEAIRIVYLIGVGGRPRAHLIVSRLLYALYNPSHLFLIHLDVKAAPEAVEACAALQRAHSNVRVLRARRLVQWGMFSMVAPMIDAVHTALHAADSGRLPFDFFINLSDADLALRTDAEIRRFLDGMRGRSLINIHEGGGEQLKAANSFINSHVIVECGGYGFVVANHTPDSFPLTHDCCIGRSGPAAFAPGLGLDVHPKLADKARVHTGSQWTVLSYSFCRELLRGNEADEWFAAYERRLVPDESMLHTIAMHSPAHRHSLLNHNLRWIDWPHQYGDPNEYWQRLGSRGYIGGPKVLNASELIPILTSPYMFARKVDPEIDANVLRIWDQWMAAKLARGDGVVSAAALPGAIPGVPAQAPIAHSPGDPQLSIRFKAPGVAREMARERAAGRRRIAMIAYSDGSACGCGSGCGALTAGCCAKALCRDGREASDLPDLRHKSYWRKDGSSEVGGAGTGAGAAMDGAGLPPLPPCPDPSSNVTSQPGGPPLVVSFINRARFPVAVSVLNYEGDELSMRTLRRLADSATFVSQAGVVWRVRALSGELILEITPRASGSEGGANSSGGGSSGGDASLLAGEPVSEVTAAGAGTSEVTISECEPRHRGVAALIARGLLNTGPNAASTAKW